MGSDFDWGVGGDLRVRSSVGFAPPYIVVHGSTGFCLLSRRAKFWSKRPPPLPPLGQTRDENQGGNLLPQTCGQSSPPLRGVGLPRGAWRRVRIGGHQMSLSTTS